MSMDTLTLKVNAKIVGGKSVQKFRYFIGGKLINLAEWVMKTKIKVSIEQEKP